MAITGLAAVLASTLLAFLVGGGPSAGASGPPDPAAGDPAVFFYDDFESGDLSKWDDRDQDLSDPNLTVVSDPEHVRSGAHALQITAPLGPESGAKLPVWFPPGYDTVNARWYCMFAPDFDQGNLMHFVHLLGGPPDDPFAAFGKAGTRATSWFSTGFEPWRAWGRHPAPGAMMFYTYYPEMKPSRDGRWWGNMFMTEPPFTIEPGRWYCMEIMLKCNTPGKTDGEQAAWIDGRQVLHVRGLRWRDSDAIKIHCFWLLLYIHESAQLNRVWFDDIALGRAYIGPLTD
jgi:hypothetical protein